MIQKPKQPLIREKVEPSEGTLPILLHPSVPYTLSSSYPHEYHDFEGFSFSCGGSTYYEFPILTTGEVFDGSTSPGPDRVIFEYVVPGSFRDGPQSSPLLC